jgi:homoserine dehydrogenase
LGYAETDPSFDVDGLDSAHKLAILAALSFGTPVSLEDIPCEGISRLDVTDVRYAEDLGYAVKLLAIGKRTAAGAIELRVHPTLVPKAHPLAAVSDVFNAAEFVGDSTGRVMFYGRGAGREPTASAVVADLIEAARGYLPATTRELAFWTGGRALDVAPPGDAASRFYVRFTARDEFGVLGKVARILGEHRVSIASVIQKEPARDVPAGRAGGELLPWLSPRGCALAPQNGAGAVRGQGVPIVMLTHEARERDFQDALREIGALECIERESVFLHIEE